jgi:hypothetical protein
MNDYSELRKAAEACGPLPWRLIELGVTRSGVRDDHGFIAFMDYGHPAKYGACPDREAKARFIGHATPAAVLSLIEVVDQQKALIASLRNDLQEAIAIDCDDDAKDACDEVERTGTPGSVIREMNDELADLRARLVERDSLLRGLVEYADGLLSDVNNAWAYAGSTGTPETHKDDDYARAVALLSTSAEPSAQAGRDEQALFEAWHKSVVKGEPPHEKYNNGDYRNQHVQRYWLGWKSRAEQEVKS